MQVFLLRKELGSIRFTGSVMKYYTILIRKNWIQYLRANKQTEPDSIYTFSITRDSAYVFALTNYQSGLTETKIAGETGQVSEVRQEGDLKFLYKLKVDESALKKTQYKSTFD